MSHRRKLHILIRRQRGRCYLCQGPLIKPTADHVRPKARGGSNAISNLRAACESCNRAKGCMTLKQYREWQKEKAA